MDISKFSIKLFTFFLVTVVLAGCGYRYNVSVSKHLIIDQDKPYPAHDASIVEYKFPDVVEVGKTYLLEITFENIGETSWFLVEKFGVGFGAGTLSFGGKSKIFLMPYSFVRPGMKYVFETELTIPYQPGEYFEHFRMIRFVDRWFGETLELRMRIDEVSN